MKNRILLTILIIMGSMQTIKTETCNNDSTYSCDNDYVEYDYDADDIAICRSILDYDIEQLKSFIVPGNEMAVVKFLAPNIDFDQYYKDFFESCTFMHMLTCLLNRHDLTALKKSFSPAEIDLYTSKVLNLIRYAATIGININAQDCDGDTALSSALLYGAFDAAILLIQLGANVNFADKDGSTPLYLAIQNSFDQYEDYCYFASEDYCYFASEDEASKPFVLISNVEMVKALLVAGAEITITVDGVNYEFSQLLDQTISKITCELNPWNADQSLIILKDELLAIKAVLQS